MKQARAAGLGVVLATQNPVDLDYKGLANAGTWLIGRLQTERDRERLLDGLEGAQAGGGFDRAAASAAIAGLGQAPVPAARRARGRAGRALVALGDVVPRRPADARPDPAPDAGRRAAPATTARRGAADRRPPRRPPRPSAAGRPPLPPDVPRCFLPVARPRPGGRLAALRAGAPGRGGGALPAGDRRARPRRGRGVPRAARRRRRRRSTGPRRRRPACERRRLPPPRRRARRRTATRRRPRREAKRYAAWQREFVTWLTQSQEVTVLRRSG